MAKTAKTIGYQIGALFRYLNQQEAIAVKYPVRTSEGYIQKGVMVSMGNNPTINSEHYCHQVPGHRNTPTYYGI